MPHIMIADILRASTDLTVTMPDIPVLVLVSEIVILVRDIDPMEVEAILETTDPMGLVTVMERMADAARAATVTGTGPMDAVIGMMMGAGPEASAMTERAEMLAA
jgi:hypothetical protein